MIEANREANHFTRKRKLTIQHVITYLLFSSKASMFSNLAAIKEDIPDVDFPNVSKQAISKARQFINPNLFKELYYLSVDRFYSSSKERKTWHGYHLFAVDGSRIELPNSESNFNHFGKMFTTKNSSGDKKYYTHGLASIIYDVLEDYVVHASLNKYLASERAAAKEHLSHLEALNIYENSVIIFDRGYYSDDFFTYCVDHNHYCVIRLKEKLNLSRKALNSDNITTNITVGDKNNPRDITVRVIRVILPDGTNEFLATNIFDDSITSEMFRELYFYRWPIEIKYKELKTRLQLEEFNGATKNSIYQEFYINMLLTNLTSLIKNQADEEIDKCNNPTNKYRYQSNRSFIISRIKKVISRIIAGILSLDAIDLIYFDALNAKSQLQPGRSSKRRTSTRNKRSHFRNIKTAF